MKVLLTGATGFIGSAVLARLLDAGHDVTAVVRSETSGARAHAAGAVTVVHALDDVAWLTQALRDSDAAIHTATSDDPSALDDAVISAVISAFAGTGKPYVHTGGVWVHGSGADLTEQSPLDPPALTAWRVEREARLLGSDVRASVVEPAIVYGNSGGMTNLIVHAPEVDGALVVPGSGDQHWSTVHVDDLADLYLAVLESAPGGQSYIAASGVSPTVREIGEATGKPVVGEPDDATRERFGAQFADAMLLSQQASGSLAKSVFGWTPDRPTLLELVRAGY